MLLYLSVQERLRAEQAAVRRDPCLGRLPDCRLVYTSASGNHQARHPAPGQEGRRQEDLRPHLRGDQKSPQGAAQHPGRPPQEERQDRG